MLFADGKAATDQIAVKPELSWLCFSSYKNLCVLFIYSARKKVSNNPFFIAPNFQFLDIYPFFYLFLLSLYFIWTSPDFFHVLLGYCYDRSSNPWQLKYRSKGIIKISCTGVYFCFIVFRRVSSEYTCGLHSASPTSVLCYLLTCAPKVKCATSPATLSDLPCR